MKADTKMIFFLESSKNMGGQEWQLLQQMESLNARGFATLLFCNAQGRINEQARARGLSVMNVPFRNSGHLPTIQVLRREIKRQRPLACICHSGHDANNLYIAALTLLHRPKIIRSRTYYTNKKPNPLSRFLPIDVVMVPSQFMADKVTPQFPGKQIEVVYPGIAFEKLDREVDLPLSHSLATWLSEGEGEVLIQLGMLREEKGHSIILAALSELVLHWPHLRYVIAGGGNAEPLQKEITQRGLQQRVWVGELSSVAAALKCADILVMPSTKEPLGMAQIEALGLAVPVIISNEGGLPETVQNGVTGIIVSSNEPQAWVKAIDSALSNKETIRAYAEVGKKDVRTRFGRDINTEKLIQIVTE
ncbi:glycosyltransferase family 4 protein [Pectobacterium aroidearum]|uniref:glycosyltransferase family 4 protein n=1 Tax=Pectobacterium aroidearum TaxID=1201031 RepID=UPI002115A874|nr:glycosyltransferase family 4 protein [Pectobacterium aroidearum]UUE57549.1 glycosyltransferase family 4 protein [Pectobacterium aroidearum]UUE70254.1 glycosyltransferase family 4 protein [Pectobacterium aroidearum]UUE74632.1 glycosyltransferase family 4 protein [Pectobacterium aroidearum]UUE78962.1 glycosyltransferase family 4 protein [Pectobacterium aroidearum]